MRSCTSLFFPLSQPIMYLSATSFLLFLFLGWVSAGCPDGWISAGLASDKCYFHDQHIMSWKEAVDTCSRQNATLTSVHNMHENNFLTELLASQTAWIGFFSEGSDFACPFGHNRSSLPILDKDLKPRMTRNFYWQDGSDASFWVWSHGGHLGSHVQPDCNASCCFTFIDPEGMWNDQDINDDERRHTAICSRPTNKTNLQEHSFSDPNDRDLLVRWDRELDFLIRMNAERIEELASQTNTIEKSVEQASSVVKETRSLLAVFVFISLVTVTAFCVLVSLLFRRLQSYPCFGPKNIRFQSLFNEEDRV